MPRCYWFVTLLGNNQEHLTAFDVGGVFCLKNLRGPWPVWLRCFSSVPCIERPLVWFQFVAHAVVWPWFPTRGLGEEGFRRRQPVNVSLTLKSIKHWGGGILVGGRTLNLKVNCSLSCIFWGHLTFTGLPQKPGLGRARGPQLLLLSRGAVTVRLEPLVPRTLALDKRQWLSPTWSPQRSSVVCILGCSGLWSLQARPSWAFCEVSPVLQ